MWFFVEPSQNASSFPYPNNQWNVNLVFLLFHLPAKSRDLSVAFTVLLGAHVLVTTSRHFSEVVGGIQRFSTRYSKRYIIYFHTKSVNPLYNKRQYQSNKVPSWLRPPKILNFYQQLQSRWRFIWSKQILLMVLNYWLWFNLSTLPLSMIPSALVHMHTSSDFWSYKAVIL
jgi:hypothetical protein